MKKPLLAGLLAAMLVFHVAAERPTPTRGLSASRLFELGLFESPQQAVLRTRNLENSKGNFCNEYAVEQAGLAPPVNLLTFPDSIPLGGLEVNQKFGNFNYSSFDGTVRTGLNFLAWSPDGAHLDTNQNGVPEPDEPRMEIDGQTVRIDQIENYLPTMPRGRYHYSFWDGIELGHAPFLVESSIQWNGQSDSTLQIINRNYDFPYIVTGPTGGLDVTSEIQIVNTDITDWTLQIDFRDLLTGDPADARIGGSVRSSHEVTVRAGSSRQLKVESADGQFSAYSAHLWTNYDLGSPALQLNARYTTRDGEGKLKGSAGISVGRSDTFHALAVSRDMKVDTGVGLYLTPLYSEHPPADVNLLLLGENDQVLGSATTQVGAGQAVVKFLGEFFDLPNGSTQDLQVLPEEFQGTLLITAPYDVTVFALQTENGFQQSSLTSNGSPMQLF